MQNLLRFMLLRLASWFYRLELRGVENIPAEGGALLVSNHVTWADGFLISLLTKRHVRFVIFQGFFSVRLVGWIIRASGAIPISAKRPREAIRATAQAIRDGHIVCVFPEGQLSRSGLMSEFRKGIELISRESGMPVIPLYMDGLWGSLFSFERGRFFFKWPHRMRHAVSIAVGKAVPAAEVRGEDIHRRMQELSVEAFSARPELRRPLPAAILDSLKRRPTRPAFVEHSRPGGPGKSRRKVSRASAIAAGIALAARWRRTLPEDERRIGILLPGGAASAFMNLGLVLAGRVPVNLPFGGDPKQLAEQLEQLGIRTVLTSRAFAPALEGFPWCGGTPGTFADLRGEIDAAGSVRMLMERARACLEPRWMARRRLDLAGDPDDDIADAEAFGYLWQSRDGEWRTTFLSHFDVQAAVEQLFNGSMLAQNGEKVFCELPMNTAAGALFSLWVPVLGQAQCLGRSAAARAEAGLIESVLSAEKATLLISSPELREQVAAGEEWHPALATHIERCLGLETELAAVDHACARDFEAKTGLLLLHGWAPEVAGRVVSLSMPDLPAPKPNQMDQPGQRPGSVGRPLPGSAIEANGGEDTDANSPRDLRLRLPSCGGGKILQAGHHGWTDAAGFVFLEATTAPEAREEADSGS